MHTSIRIKTIIRCPICKFHQEEIMSETGCRVTYTCPECAARLKPKPGDCCVYTSYGNVPCPAVQEGIDGGCSEREKL